MFYEINVALNGKHLFATAERSITNQADCRKVIKIFKEKFPENEGYHISATYWESTGQILDINKI